MDLPVIADPSTVATSNDVIVSTPSGVPYLYVDPTAGTVTPVEHPLPVGTTIARGSVLIHRFAESFRITDMTNAGKRGKKCRVSSVIMGHGPNRPPSFDGYARALAEYNSYDRCIAFLTDMLHDYPEGIEVDEHVERGIDVPAPSTPAVVITGTFVRVEASTQDFVIRDLVDRNNEPTAIPPCRGAKKTSVAAFYKWAQENALRIREMRFHDLLSEMGTVGISYHYYCAVD